jgi:hypothetical protein
MAVTYGFYNSSNGDRKYNALQFSRLFEGIIRDGVFSTVGGSLMVVAASNLTVNISSGRAWFNNTWTNNDAPLPLTLDPAEAILNRYDAIVLEVAPNERENRFKIVKGTPATTPAKPTMIKTGGIYQYPLAYIYVGKGVGSISQANISNAVGTTECPFITGAMQQVTTNDIMAQWESEFNTWFDDLQAQLEGNVVTNLQNQINTKLTANGGDGKDVVVSFTEAATEAHISSGEKLSVLFGKILKMFKGKAPNSHASTGTTYGVGTTANYGHCKTINGLTQSSHVNGNALSAYQGKLLKDSIDVINTMISASSTKVLPAGTPSQTGHLLAEHPIDLSNTKFLALRLWANKGTPGIFHQELNVLAFWEVNSLMFILNDTRSKYLVDGVYYIRYDGGTKHSCSLGFKYDAALKKIQVYMLNRDAISENTGPVTVNYSYTIKPC